MSSRTTDQIWHDIRRLQRMPTAERNEYSYRLPLVKLLEELFLSDIGYAYEKKADVLFFTIQKDSLETLKSHFEKKGLPHSSVEKVNYVNALNQCFSELVELALLTQEKYGFVIDSLPPPFIVFPDMLPPRSKDSELNDILRNKFINFICLRLGDISRYLLDLSTARMFYERAVKAVPTDGQAYNQIGLIEAVEHNSLDALFWHIFAVNTQEPFAPAAANIENLYKRHFSINIDDKRLRYDALFISFAGSCHSLLETTDHFISRLSELLRSENIRIVRLGMHFVILISIWSNMVNSTDEIKCANYIASVIGDQFLFILDQYSAKKFQSEEEDKVLSLIWIYASWLDEKKVSIAKIAPKENSWVECFVRSLDGLTRKEKFENEVEPLQYFCPLSSFNFQKVDSHTLFLRLKSIFYRILRFYRIPDAPSEQFEEFFQKNRELFVEKRRVRTSHTVPILSAL